MGKRLGRTKGRHESGQDEAVMDESPKSVMISSISSVVKHLSGAKSPRSVETAKELEHVKQSERSVLETTAPKHSGPRPKFIPDTDCSLLLRPLYPLVANQRQNGFGVLRIQVQGASFH